jgi:hypothetical protein
MLSSHTLVIIRPFLLEKVETAVRLEDYQGGERQAPADGAEAL